jgi:hypothetical protein
VNPRNNPPEWTDQDGTPLRWKLKFRDFDPTSQAAVSTTNTKEKTDA